MLPALSSFDTRVAVFSRLARGLSPLTGGKDHFSSFSACRFDPTNGSDIFEVGIRGLCSLCTGCLFLRGFLGLNLDRRFHHGLAGSFSAFPSHPVTGLKAISALLWRLAQRS